MISNKLRSFINAIEKVIFMSKAAVKAQEIIDLIKSGNSIESIKSQVSSSADEWHKYSSKAYNICLEKEGKERKSLKNKPHVSVTPNEDITSILNLNKILGNYGLLLPIFSTNPELTSIKNLSAQLPASESQIIQIIGNMTVHPRIRVMQKKGRMEKFEYFKIFSKLLDAAVLSYYRTNFISCYLTLLPIVEGVIIRWMGYTELDKKPEFEDIRKFFKNSAQRQPFPFNIQFHDLYVKVCDKILNEHFYLPTEKGSAYANFNRHVASHLLNDNQFATKENCIRLFILIDTMTEVYLYESRQNDPRFELNNDDLKDDIGYFATALLDNISATPEHLILGTSISDLPVAKTK